MFESRCYQYFFLLFLFFVIFPANLKKKCISNQIDFMLNLGLSFKLNLGFALLLQFSFNSLALPLLTSFHFWTPSFSLSFALLQKRCFFRCLLTATLMSKFLESHQKNFPRYSAVPISSHQWVRMFINPPADVLYWYIHFTFLYLNCFLHAVIYLYIVLCLL